MRFISDTQQKQSLIPFHLSSRLIMQRYLIQSTRSHEILPHRKVFRGSAGRLDGAIDSSMTDGNKAEERILPLANGLGIIWRIHERIPELMDQQHILLLLPQSLGELTDHHPLIIAEWKLAKSVVLARAIKICQKSNHLQTIVFQSLVICMDLESLSCLERSPSPETSA